MQPVIWQVQRTVVFLYVTTSHSLFLPKTGVIITSMRNVLWEIGTVVDQLVGQSVSSKSVPP